MGSLFFFFPSKGVGFTFGKCEGPPLVPDGTLASMGWLVVATGGREGDGFTWASCFFPDYWLEPGHLFLSMPNFLFN